MFQCVFPLILASLLLISVVDVTNYIPLISSVFEICEKRLIIIIIIIRNKSPPFFNILRKYTARHSFQMI